MEVKTYMLLLRDLLFEFREGQRAPEGIVLKHQGAITGCCLYSFMNAKKGTRMLWIDFLYIASEERNAGVISKLVTALRRVAEEENAQSLGWEPKSAHAKKLSKKIGDRKFPFSYTMPVEKLDIKTLVTMNSVSN